MSTKIADTVRTTELETVLTILANRRKLYVTYIVRPTGASLKYGVDMLSNTTEYEVADPDKGHIAYDDLGLVTFAVLVRLLVG